jgi:hypothetical protein
VAEQARLNFRNENKIRAFICPVTQLWGIRRLISETQHTNVLNNYILISSDPQIDAAIASLIKSFFLKKTSQSQQHATASIIYGTRAALNP